MEYGIDGVTITWEVPETLGDQAIPIEAYARAAMAGVRSHGRTDAPLRSNYSDDSFDFYRDGVNILAKDLDAGIEQSCNNAGGQCTCFESYAYNARKIPGVMVNGKCRHPSIAGEFKPATATLFQNHLRPQKQKLLPAEEQLSLL